MRKWLVGVGLVLAGLLLAGAARAQSLEGAGSTFIAPLMNKWAKTYEKEKKVPIKYQVVGSAVGAKRLLDKKVDFGCTDVPLTGKALEAAKKAGDEVLHVPLALGAVVPVYNLPGLEKSSLRFTGPVLADIYLGKITKWNDPALKKVNPGVALPDRPIVVVYRADNSGTSLIWVDYLGKVSKEAKDKLGVSGKPKFPVGVGAKGNLAVANEVAKTPGALGYVELVYALAKKLPFGSVQNRQGAFITPGRKSTAAALAGLKKVPGDLRFSLTDSPGKDAYPICGTTWALVHVKQPKDKAQALVDFLTWAHREGQKYATELHYAPLPKPIVEQIEKRLKLITVAK
jgi:phosphate transport system substrate-binding protein